MQKQNMVMVGAGRMAWAIAKLMALLDFEVSAVCNRSDISGKKLAKAFECPYFPLTKAPLAKDIWKNAQVVCLAVSDNAIAEVAKDLKPHLPKDCTVFHCSGIYSHEIIEIHLPHQYCASLHPLAPCPLITESAKGVRNYYHKAIFAIDGAPEAIDYLKPLVESVEGQLVRITPDSKAKYHAAAVFASNYPLTLIDVGARIFQQCGFPVELAEEAATSLFLRSGTNVSGTHYREALTGPAKRGDTQTLQMHEEALSGTDMLSLYQLLLEHTLTMLKTLNSER